ncbi:MAG: nucleotidyltransferase family protein [Eubacterium sp.]|nr:nucleotidyltransferase family protein [Eubacterium sp.]
MNIGIICEFNPFHKGHKYLFDSVKGEGDRIICVMSGNFVQRGEAAAVSKFERAKTAVENGADLVLELVTPCATLSAQGFAQSGIKILENTGICDSIAFGAECDDVDALSAVCEEIRAKDSEIRAALADGCSYPAALRKAVDSPLLDSPNNILAIEYLTCTSLKPIAVKRIGGGHDSDDVDYSASAIRKTMAHKAELKNCERAVLYRLRTMSAEDFADIDDVSEGLENRIAEAVKTAANLDELYDNIKTKRYTHARIRRIILRAFLGITRETDREPRYLRVLAVGDNGKELLSEIGKNATLPVVTRYRDAKQAGGEVLTQFENECRYTDIYALCANEVLPCGEDMTFGLKYK